MTQTAPATVQDRKDYLYAIAQVRTASAAYHNNGETPLDDATYDRLRQDVATYEKAHPTHVSEDSPTGKVAEGALAPGAVPHTVPMGSLRNVTTPDALRDWHAGLVPSFAGGLTVENKLDGVALAARYVNGRLVELLLRGNGRLGDDVSHAVDTNKIRGLPKQLAQPFTFEARGEVVFTFEQFERANAMRARYGAKLFSSPRAAAAGTLRATNRLYRLEMTFFAYHAVALPLGVGKPLAAVGTQAELMEQVAGAGVQTTAATVHGLRVVPTVAEAQQRVEQIAAERAALPYGIDGVVIKANSLAQQAAAGSDTRAPLWAVAYKLSAAERVTTLLDVKWSVGRTGVMAPRAVLEEVELGGSTVSSATLHNPSDIGRLDLRLGDSVTVILAQDIIPRVLAPVVHLRPKAAEPIEMPMTCPVCGGGLDKSQERWRCAAAAVGKSACGLRAALLYAAGRDLLAIDGLGPSVIAGLVDHGDAEDVGDLFFLTREQLAQAAGGSMVVADKLFAQIEAAKTRPLHHVLAALGLVGTGREMSERLAAHFGSMEGLLAADVSALTEVDGIGMKKAQLIAGQFPRAAKVVAKLAAAGVNLTGPPSTEGGDTAVSRPLAGKSVVVTGTMTSRLAGYDRAGMRHLVKLAGGSLSESVTKKTSFLVVGQRAGSKVAKAEKLGVAMLTEDAFASLVSDLLAPALNAMAGERT
ncbi:NAD-dependent DNA ligase LigA [Streptomyces sp. NPDC015125]|uniref:NAD-dependent DNA ligase LigA n=1 Tax=Streptomyces sp. NPDC015125 TaxID=3364938 RepID=UPI0036F6E667